MSMETGRLSAKSERSTVGLLGDKGVNFGRKRFQFLDFTRRRKPSLSRCALQPSQRPQQIRFFLRQYGAQIQQQPVAFDSSQHGRFA